MGFSISETVTQLITIATYNFLNIHKTPKIRRILYP